MKFLISVKIFQEHEYLKTEDHIDTVLKWYTEMFESWKEYEPKIIFSKRYNQFVLECNDAEVANILADPDVDGNHPVVIRGYRYLIAGNILCQ